MLYGESCFIAYWIGNFLALFFLGIFSFYNIVMTRNEVVKLKSCLGFCPFFVAANCSYYLLLISSLSIALVILCYSSGSRLLISLANIHAMNCLNFPKIRCDESVITFLS